jgi:hypothetical protein
MPAGSRLTDHQLARTLDDHLKRVYIFGEVMLPSAGKSKPQRNEIGGRLFDINFKVKDPLFATEPVGCPLSSVDFISFFGCFRAALAAAFLAYCRSQGRGWQSTTTAIRKFRAQIYFSTPDDLAPDVRVLIRSRHAR